MEDLHRQVVQSLHVLPYSDSKIFTLPNIEMAAVKLILIMTRKHLSIYFILKI